MYLFLVLYRSISLQSLSFLVSRNWWKIVLFLQSNSLTISRVSQKYQALLKHNSHDSFSKILRTFYASRKLWIIVVFLLCTHKEKLPIFLIVTYLLHIPLLALTDRQNDGRKNEYTRCAWAGGTFFQLYCCVSFWFWREIKEFGFRFLCI